jgi:hypothetical protein
MRATIASTYVFCSYLYTAATVVEGWEVSTICLGEVLQSETLNNNSLTLLQRLVFFDGKHKDHGNCLVVCYAS